MIAKTQRREAEKLLRTDDRTLANTAAVRKPNPLSVLFFASLRLRGFAFRPYAFVFSFSA